MVAKKCYLYSKSLLMDGYLGHYLRPVSRTAKGKLKWPLFARPMPRLYKISMTSLMIFFQKFLLAPPDRCSLVDLLKDALQEVLFQRPENPIEFLKEYFAQLKNN